MRSATRRSLAAGLLAVSVAAASLAATGHDAATARPEVQALLARGEAALAAGDAAMAQAAFEQAAAREHSARVETGWVRARLQAGGYRQALGFAAHVAGVHPDEPEGALLYAQLLTLGGQDDAARQVLQRAQRRWPGVPGLAAIDPAAACKAAGLSASWSTAPVVLGEAPSADARTAGTALLLDDGRHAVVPLALVDGAGMLWVRNGLGQTRRAQPVASAGGMTLMRLSEPLPAPEPLRPVARAFPGSPAVVVGHAANTAAAAAWPQLCLGFLGAAGPSGQRLGVDVPAGSAGAPVFDTAGRWIGMVAPGAVPDLLPVPAFAGFITATAAASPASPLPLDELYERSLRSSLQLLRAP